MMCTQAAVTKKPLFKAAPPSRSQSQPEQRPSMTALATFAALQQHMRRKSEQMLRQRSAKNE